MTKKSEEPIIEEVTKAPEKKERDLRIKTSVNSDIREINEKLGRC